MRPLLLILLASSTAVADPKLGPCPTVTKNSGRPLGWSRAPEGCKIKPGDTKPRLLTKPSEWMAHLQCLDKAPKLGVDFTKDQLVVMTPVFVKGQNGIDAFDDGKTLTIVKMFGSMCPKDAPIVPGKPVAPRVYSLGKGPRTITEVSCAKQWRC